MTTELTTVQKAYDAFISRMYPVRGAVTYRTRAFHYVHGVLRCKQQDSLFPPILAFVDGLDFYKLYSSQELPRAFHCVHVRDITGNFGLPCRCCGHAVVFTARELATFAVDMVSEYVDSSYEEIANDCDICPSCSGLTARVDA